MVTSLNEEGEEFSALGTTTKRRLLAIEDCNRSGSEAMATSEGTVTCWIILLLTRTNHKHFPFLQAQRSTNIVRVLGKTY